MPLFYFRVTAYIFWGPARSVKCWNWGPETIWHNMPSIQFFEITPLVHILIFYNYNSLTPSTPRGIVEPPPLPRLLNVSWCRVLMLQLSSIRILSSNITGNVPFPAVGKRSKTIFLAEHPMSRIPSSKNSTVLIVLGSLWNLKKCPYFLRKFFILVYALCTMFP